MKIEGQVISRRTSYFIQRSKIKVDHRVKCYHYVTCWLCHILETHWYVKYDLKKYSAENDVRIVSGAPHQALSNQLLDKLDKLKPILQIMVFKGIILKWNVCISIGRLHKVHEFRIIYTFQVLPRNWMRLPMADFRFLMYLFIEQLHTYFVC